MSRLRNDHFPLTAHFLVPQAKQMSAPSTSILMFLRLSLLALLVLGQLARPLMEQIGEVHAAGHAVLAAGDVDHSHDHPDHDPAKDPDHTKGIHGLMHQGDAGPSAALWPTWGFATTLPPPASPPMAVTTALRPQVPNSLFRPPIA